VIAWGEQEFGGKIPNKIQNVKIKIKMVFSTRGAFAMLLENDTVFAWGDEAFGGKIPNNEEFLKNVKTIFPQREGFTAIFHNGETLNWGKF